MAGRGRVCVVVRRLQLGQHLRGRAVVGRGHQLGEAAVERLRELLLVAAGLTAKLVGKLGGQRAQRLRQLADRGVEHLAQQRFHEQAQRGEHRAQREVPDDRQAFLREFGSALREFLRLVQQLAEKELLDVRRIGEPVDPGDRLDFAFLQGVRRAVAEVRFQRAQHPVGLARQVLQPLRGVGGGERRRLRVVRPGSDRLEVPGRGLVGQRLQDFGEFGVFEFGEQGVGRLGRAGAIPGGDRGLGER